jgi:hypothetical protein
VAAVIRSLGCFLLCMQLEVLDIETDMVLGLLSMLEALAAIQNIVWYLQE